jgi:hypothetical protein
MGTLCYREHEHGRNYIESLETCFNDMLIEDDDNDDKSNNEDMEDTKFLSEQPWPSV